MASLRHTNPGPRFDAALFRERLADHLRRRGLAWLLATAAVFLFCGEFRLGLNVTASLPHTLFLIHKGASVQRGDYLAFRWPGGGPYPAGVIFIKIVAGVAGDSVTRIDREFFVEGIPVGRAKTASRHGLPLAPGLTGVIPPGRWYVRAPHPDSLDSRYALTGWIADHQILGRAYALF